MRKTSWLSVVLVMLLLVGCGVNNPAPTTIPTEDNQTEEATTTAKQAPIADSIFDDPQYGDEKPVKTEDSSDTAISEEDKTESSEEDKQGNTDGNKQENSDNTATGNGSASNLPAPGSLSYEEFIKLTPEQQQAYQESYGLDEAGLATFFKWYSEAKAQYEKEHPPEEIPDDGNINLG